jgi:hypothetical protein
VLCVCKKKKKKCLASTQPLKNHVEESRKRLVLLYLVLLFVFIAIITAFFSIVIDKTQVLDLEQKRIDNSIKKQAEKGLTDEQRKILEEREKAVRMKEWVVLAKSVYVNFFNL